ncbi:hypothetical protein BS17DRAFT_159661 [Gyrodon lividus]|nr:hypothetical protein BS17DRAFT_159661 [Gyrodon lividus]
MQRIRSSIRLTPSLLPEVRERLWYTRTYLLIYGTLQKLSEYGVTGVLVFFAAFWVPRFVCGRRVVHPTSPR